jgi:hypothetical protein
VARAGVGEPTFLQAHDDLGAEYPRRLEQQSGQIRLAHACIVARRSANVNLLDLWLRDRRAAVRSHDDGRGSSRATG